MPHDPITVNRHIEEKTYTGGHDRMVFEKYIPPADVETGGFAVDPHRERDLDMARHVRTYLLTRFPVGYEWCVEADIAQGVLKISIPILMGVRNWYVVNLHTTPIDRGVLRGAGEILERYRLSRSRFNLGSFLDARAAHSALVVPSRRVPS